MSDIDEVPVVFSIPVFPFGRTRIPEAVKPASYNDDLYMESFRPTRAIWPGEQRNGIPFNIPDATSHSGHVRKALGKPFRLSNPAPLPADLSDAVRYIRDTPDISILNTWPVQLQAVKNLATAAQTAQLLWEAASRPKLDSSFREDSCRCHGSPPFSVRTGGPRWMRQFAHGFEVMGDFSQKFLFPADPMIKPPLDPGSPLVDAAERFATRAR